MPRSVSYDEYLIERLKDPKQAEGYLKTALEDNDPPVFLLALRHVNLTGTPLNSSVPPG